MTLTASPISMRRTPYGIEHEAVAEITTSQMGTDRVR